MMIYDWSLVIFHLLIAVNFTVILL